MINLSFRIDCPSGVFVGKEVRWIKTSLSLSEKKVEGGSWGP